MGVSRVIWISIGTVIGTISAWARWCTTPWNAVSWVWVTGAMVSCWWSTVIIRVIWVIVVVLVVAIRSACCAISWRFTTPWYAIAGSWETIGIVIVICCHP